MAACEPIYFENVSTETFESIRQELASKGFALPDGNEGTVSGPFGIVVSYVYNTEKQSLGLQVMEKSFFVTCDQIKRQFQDAFTRYIA